MKKKILFVFILTLFYTTIMVECVSADYYFKSDIIDNTDAEYVKNNSKGVNIKIFTNINGRYYLFCLEKGALFEGGQYKRYGQIIEGPACVVADSADDILNADIKNGFKNGTISEYLINKDEPMYISIQTDIWRSLDSKKTCKTQIFGFKDVMQNSKPQTLTLNNGFYIAEIALNANTANQITSISSDYRNYITIDRNNNKLNVSIPEGELNADRFDITINSTGGDYIVPKIDQYESLLNSAYQDIGLLYFGKIQYKASDTITLKKPTPSGDGTCASELNQSDKSKSSLIKLYQQFKSRGSDYRGLLNFSNPTCDNNIIYNNSTSCFSANHINSDFTENNVSQYSEVKNPNGNPIFCSTSFVLNNTLDGALQNVKAGMLIYKGIDSKIMTGTLEKVCYLYTKGSQVNFPSSTNLYDDNIEYVKIGDINLNPTSNVRNNGVIKELGNGVYQYIYTIDLAYNLPTYNAMHGSGKIISDENLCKVVDGSKTYTKCKNIGSGIVTDLSSDETSTIPFSYRYNKKDYSADCQFTTEPGILNLEFRIIDVSKPFSGKTGNNRTVGDNWCEKTDNDLIKTCSGDPSKNKVISEYITNKNNSYNKTNEGAKYTIELTPETIKQIRSHNKKKDVSYDDFDFKCEDDVCISNYLTKLKNDGLLTIKNSKNRKIIKE